MFSTPSTIIRRTFLAVGTSQRIPRTAESRCLSSLSHVDSQNRPCMVDITSKSATARVAHAQALVELPTAAFNLIQNNHDQDKEDGSNDKDGKDGKEIEGKNVEIYSKKGPVFSTAIIAGVMGAKNTSNILPFCHPLPLEYVDIKIEIDKTLVQTLRIDCVVKTTHKTGVEMEALIGATHAAVCIYDMLKAVSHDIVIKDIKLISKSGGKSSYVNNVQDKPAA